MMEFGGKKRPLRASALPLLIACPHRAVLMELRLIEGGSSKAADTGSAVHAGIEAWHETGKLEAAIDAMKRRLPEFPDADLHDAELSLKPYTADPRNAKEVVIASEIDVLLELPCSVGGPIYITGRVDQLRADGVWDVKHSDKPGFEIMHSYAYQLAAYARGLQRPVGGFILPKGYRKRGVKEASPPGVFWSPCWDDAHIDALLAEVVATVAGIREGRVPVRPGAHCTFCPAESFGDCLTLGVRRG